MTLTRSPRQPPYRVLGIPDKVAIFLLVVALALALAPYLPGSDFGVLKVPALEREIQEILRWVGPLFFALVVLLFLPLWPTDRAEVWKVLERNLTELENLTLHHMREIETVVAPLCTNEQLRESYEAFYRLVHDPQYPTGYTKIRQALKGLESEREFKASQRLALLTRVRDALYHFQVTAFILTTDMPEAEWPSLRMADSFKTAVDLCERLTPTGGARAAAQELDRLREKLEHGIGYYPWMIGLKTVESRADVVRVMASWCAGWRDSVEHQLYGGTARDGDDLHGAIASLRNVYRTTLAE